MSAIATSLLDVFTGDESAYLATAAVALLVVTLAGFFVPRLARRFGAIDVPGGRHLHLRPTPRLGGTAVLLGVLAGVPVGFALLAGLHAEILEQAGNLAAILLIGCGVCLLGACDDVRSLRPSTKLAGLGAAGLLLALAGVRIDFVEVPMLGRFELGPFAVFATVVWVLACTNAVNLIDGVDGLGASVALVACTTLAMVAHGMGDSGSAMAFVALGGACLGFLLHNREPARLFLGDSGSLLLGFLLAAISANGCTKRSTAIFLVAGLCTLAIPLLDSTLAFVRRFARSGVPGHGRSAAALFRRLAATAVGDREHLHHRLLVKGLSHRQVTRAICLCAMVPAITAVLLLPTGSVGWLTVAGAVLASGSVLWRLAALPTAVSVPQPFSRPAVAAEKDVVLPSRPRRRIGRRGGRVRPQEPV